MRDGRVIGVRASENQSSLYTLDRFHESDFDPARTDEVDDYRLSSEGDSDYREPTAPVRVHRKSKPTDLARVGQWAYAAPVRHTIYLVLPRPPREGCTYRLDFEHLPLGFQEFTFDPGRLRSEAVHVSHLGFRPDDPAKVAFLSCWTRSGCGLDYPEGLEFHAVESASGETFFRGVTALSKAVEDAIEDLYNRNYNGADAHQIAIPCMWTPASATSHHTGIRASANTPCINPWRATPTSGATWPPGSSGLSCVAGRPLRIRGPDGAGERRRGGLPCSGRVQISQQIVLRKINTSFASGTTPTARHRSMPAQKYTEQCLRYSDQNYWVLAQFLPS